MNKNKTIGTSFTSNVHIAADSIAAWMPLALAVSMFLINMTSQHGDYDLRRANFDTNAIFSEPPLMAVVLGTALGIVGATPPIFVLPCTKIVFEFFQKLDTVVTTAFHGGDVPKE